MPTLLSAESISVTFGERPVLVDISLSVAAGERVALLGRNGAGKTTLLRVLTGEVVPEEGTVWRAPGLRVGVLEQHHAPPPGLTVRELVDAAHPYRELETELLLLEANLGDPQTLAAWTALHARLEDAGAYTWPARAARVLGMLDLTRFIFREAATLSGGERTRLALALALAREPDLLILDEPTNHLDIRMREWLEDWLRDFRGGVLLTSHDRDFLDAAATRSLWLEDGEGADYPGGYSRARAQRDLERRTRERAARLGEREAARLAGSVEQLDRWGRRSRALKTRAERLPVIEAPLPERQLRMRLLAGTARARLVAWGEHLSKTYGDRMVLQDVAFKLRQGDRVALMGANGTGKTTLMRLLAGELHPDPGPPEPVLRVANGVTVASLDQTWHGLTPGEGLKAQFERRFGTRANALLGRAGFVEADWAKTPSELSGGERARAGLALVSALRADLLILDEPTNHLDVEALLALEGAVHAYGGAVVIVTHDRRFAREVANRLWVIEDGRLREVAGWGSREYSDPARTLTGDPPPPPPPPTSRQRLVSIELQLADIRRELDAPPGTLTGREEARLRAQAHQLQAHLDELYAQAYAAPQFDAQVREPPLTVRAQKLGDCVGGRGGGMFWAARDEECPHLAWDGETLRFSALPPAWYGAALLGGALRILFEQWNVGRVRLGEGGPVLKRRAYFERIGVVSGE
ncbi:ABC-F family ATP-binding cassette domain-containing protein [Deinococcus metallilatus]|uniref:ABC-F family ATP-binding cassette domain-containing protein n=1 Tax=Deinococcus metallilatus TaxID=1211322 RepID=A0AAJ5F5Z3_9DEIO|nr:ABC-F family ATP-binding cassette domain-containing protein [Deinococcus metallilatus]MBB5294836.1 ATP-binding cassette subfamily F protein 3 [Deinococcus metallilatus]QBY09447.1 ABC-F family ATP-binding cassette domain-containing protein [Deinococcus metallilatus]RXJ09452.1 ABC-F family ATP-binding cassette domain-containing protein [Deinococcus metallilatus]TLK28975.1 ABC-F family ATP-binding cassette domain-containing protein [Deinococcus metallilatus]GMA16763.1 ABC transporter ATP-bindi